MTTFPDTEKAEKIFVPDENIVFRKIMDETILVPIRGNVADMQHIFVLNPVGEFIWQNLDGTLKVKDMVEKVLSVFDVGSETAWADVTGFVDELHERKLIAEVRA